MKEKKLMFLTLWVRISALKFRNYLDAKLKSKQKTRFQNWTFQGSGILYTGHFIYLLICIILKTIPFQKNDVGIHSTVFYLQKVIRKNRPISYCFRLSVYVFLLALFLAFFPYIWIYFFSLPLASIVVVRAQI